MMYPQSPEARHPIPWAFAEEHVEGLSKMSAVVHKYGSHLVGQIPALNNWRPTDGDKEGIRPFGHHHQKDTRPKVRRHDQGADAGLHRPGRQRRHDTPKERLGRRGALVAGAGGTFNRFLSKATNNRTDEYGGSAENRCRLLLEMCSAIKQALPGFPVFLRWSPIDLVPGGNEIEDALELAPYIDRAGFGYINVQIGWHESSVPTTRRYRRLLVLGVRRAQEGLRTAPIVTGYRETDPDVMEKILAEGKADMIGGPEEYSLADPEFPKKLRERRRKDKKVHLLLPLPRRHGGGQGHRILRREPRPRPRAAVQAAAG